MLGIDVRHINLYFALAFVLLLPFSFLLSLVIVFWGLWQIVDYKNLKLQGIYRNGWVLLSVLFFLLHVFAVFFSHNTKEALTSIEIKLGFFFLPLLVYNAGFNVHSIKRIAGFFLLSTTIAVLVCILRASYLYFSSDKGFVTYNDFSWFLHPSYFAMYLVFSLLILFVNKVRLSSNNWLHWFMLLLISGLLVSGIFLCASKMGMLTFGILVPVLILILLLRNRQYILALLSVVVSALALFVILRSDIPAVARLKNAFAFAESSAVPIDVTTAESNAVRVLIWTEAAQIIKEKPVLGFTPGDANDRLYESYKQKGLTGAMEKHLNAHNQYLQTTIGLGVVGGIILLILTLGLVIAGALKRNSLLVLFGLLTVLNFAVESMLQTQAGTLFFVFFFAVLAVPQQASGQPGNRAYRK
jgi:O-antigen ligase